jgi:uncharacterized membrane protein
MNVNFEYSKTLAIEGSILLLLSLIPYVGWVLGIVGVVLLLRSMKEFSNYYQDEKIYKDSLTGVKYYIVAIVAAAVSIAAITLGVWSATGFNASFVFTAGFGVGLIAFIAGLVVSFVFYLLAASHLKRTFDTIAQKSGEASFTTAGTLLLLGSILTIVFGIGLLLIPIAWIFATIGFFTMKSRQYQQYTPQPNGYGYTPPPTQPTQQQA